MNHEVSPEQMNLQTFSIEGELKIGFYDCEEKGPVATIYGDPVGLRSLASVLTTLADLDQQVVPLRNLPVGEGFHLHLSVDRGLKNGSSQLDLGRLDQRVE